MITELGKYLKGCGCCVVATRVCSVLLLNFCVSLSMPRATDIRRANPWESAEYKRHYGNLRDTIDPSFLRAECYKFNILDKSPRSVNNEELLELLGKGSFRTFAQFRDALRSHPTPHAFSRILEDLDAIGPEPTSKGEVTDTYFNFRKML